MSQLAERPGWDLFESLLHVHHTAEDDALWPVVREKVAGRPTTRVGANMLNFLPWLLDGADEETTTRVLRFIPAPVQQTYRNEWQPAYAAKDWWAEAGTFRSGHRRVCREPNGRRDDHRVRARRLG